MYIAQTSAAHIYIGSGKTDILLNIIRRRCECFDQMCEFVREIAVPYRYQTDQEGGKGERLSLTSLGTICCVALYRHPRV